MPVEFVAVKVIVPIFAPPTNEPSDPAPVTHAGRDLKLLQ